VRRRRNEGEKKEKEEIEEEGSARLGPALKLDMGMLACPS
jgi:hypothetical protein